MKFFLREQNGTSAIEFSFVFLPFMISILVLIEMSRLTYITTALDLIISESARSTSLLENGSDFTTTFENKFREKVEKWPLISKDVTFNANVKYCDSIEKLAVGACSDSNDSQLAVYNVDVDMSYMISLPFAPGKFKTERSIVFVQEFNRKKT